MKVSKKNKLLIWGGSILIFSFILFIISKILYVKENFANNCKYTKDNKLYYYKSKCYASCPSDNSYIITDSYNNSECVTVCPSRLYITDINNNKKCVDSCPLNTFASMVSFNLSTCINFSNLSPQQIQKLSKEQIQSLSIEQIQLIQSTKIPNFPTNFFNNLSPQQIKILSKEQIAGLSKEQIAAIFATLTPAQIAGLTTAQIAALTPEQFVAFNNLPSIQIQNLSGDQIKNITPAQMSKLTLNFLNNLKADQIKYLNANGILSLNDNIIKGSANLNWSNFSDEQKNILNKNFNFYKLLLKKPGCPFDFTKCHYDPTNLYSQSNLLFAKDNNYSDQQKNQLTKLFSEGKIENETCSYGKKNEYDEQEANGNLPQEPCYCALCSKPL